MNYFKTLFFIIFPIFLISCSSSYKELSNNTYKFDNNFSMYLNEAYKKKADFEALKMHDWNSAKLYSEKALKAVNGSNIYPEKLNNWKIPKEHIFELQLSHKNLMNIYEEAILADPYNLAIAISSLDCWAEQQEENWQVWDIQNCRNDFLKAIHKIYNSLDKDNNKKLIHNNKSKKNISVVTKDDENKILQIVYFDFDKSNLSNININEIEKFIKTFKNQINQYIITGHTDTVGSNNYNYKLSIERATEVKKILIKLGIDKDNINILGKSENDLKIKTGNNIAHPANRRAEIGLLN